MSTGRTIRLSEEHDGWWVARDEEAGVTTQGSTRSAALENLDEAVALHRGEVGSHADGTSGSVYAPSLLNTASMVVPGTIGVTRLVP